MKIDSETIAKGIDESIIGKLILGIIWGLGIFLVIVIIMVLAESIINFGGPPVTIAQQINCDKPLVDCYVINDSIVIFQKANLCGYQEAEAWFEQYKNKINNENIYLECSE